MTDTLTVEVAIPTAGAAAGTAFVALACLVAPARLLEALVVRSGTAALVNAAAPPLGFTARLLLAGGGGVLIGAVIWAVLTLVAGDRRIALRRPALRLSGSPRRDALSAGQSVRRSDSHPDAPPRAPILAERELGSPFLSIVAPTAIAVAATPTVPPATDERPLPDLDTALAAVDPAAIPDVPREPVRVVAPLAVPVLASAPLPAAPPSRPVPLAPGERIDSVELGAEARERPDSIEALLSRLERGTRRRPPREPAPLATATPGEPDAPPTGSLDETLEHLRRLATRG